jgi:hypothetical protein
MDVVEPALELTADLGERGKRLTGTPLGRGAFFWVDLEQRGPA